MPLLRVQRPLMLMCSTCRIQSAYVHSHIILNKDKATTNATSSESDTAGTTTGASHPHSEEEGKEGEQQQELPTVPYAFVPPGSDQRSIVVDLTKGDKPRHQRKPWEEDPVDKGLNLYADEDRCTNPYYIHAMKTDTPPPPCLSSSPFFPLSLPPIYSIGCRGDPSTPLPDRTLNTVEKRALNAFTWMIMIGLGAYLVLEGAGSNTTKEGQPIMEDALTPLRARWMEVKKEGRHRVRMRPQQEETQTAATGDAVQL